MDKLTMAHEWNIKALEVLGDKYNVDDAVTASWQYADAMQAEADKRNPHKGLPRNAAGGIDWSKWQPDWSQAPDTAVSWEMRYGSDCEARWIHDHTLTGYRYSLAPTFGYAGPWQESLRKRP